MSSRAGGLHPLHPREGSSAEAYPLRAPGWRIEVNARDVTREVSPMVRSVRYTDHSHGQSDDVEVVFNDLDGRWRSEWRPEKGDSLALWIGYVGEPSLRCGTFEVDEVEGAGGSDGDTLAVRGLAAGHHPALRTKRDRAFEKQTLEQIIRAVAKPHGLPVVAEGGPLREVRFAREAQRSESDLDFLMRLAEEHGYVFSVRPDALVFTDLDELEGRPSVLTIERGACQDWSITDTNRELYRACIVSGHYVKGKTAFSHEVADPRVKVGDVLKMTGLRVTSRAQAEARARAALRRLNRRKTPGSLVLEGDPHLTAGLNYDLADFGRWTGKYHAVSTTHRVGRTGGYVVDLEVKGVG